MLSFLTLFLLFSRSTKREVEEELMEKCGGRPVCLIPFYTCCVFWLSLLFSFFSGSSSHCSLAVGEIIGERGGGYGE